VDSHLTAVDVHWKRSLVVLGLNAESRLTGFAVMHRQCHRSGKRHYCPIFGLMSLVSEASWVHILARLVRPSRGGPARRVRHDSLFFDSLTESSKGSDPYGMSWRRAIGSIGLHRRGRGRADRACRARTGYSRNR